LVTRIKPPVLYSFRRCPYAIRARMALYYSNIQCELREVVLKNKPQAMLAVSSKATVPILVFEDRVLDESLDLIDWALAQSDPDNWAIRSLNHPLVQSNDQYFVEHLNKYKYFERFPEQSQREYLRTACVFIAELENALLTNSQGDCFLDSHQLSSVDIALFPFVRQFAFVDKPVFDRLPYPKVQRWLAQLLDSDLFDSVMIKYPAWEPGQPPVIFGVCE